MKIALALSLAAFAVALCAAPAIAQPTGNEEWVRVGDNAQGATFYVRPSDGGQPPVVRFWERIEFAQATNMGDRSMRDLVEIDCASGRLRSLQLTGFAGPNLTGRSETDQGSGVWNPIEGGSISDQMRQIVCTAMSQGGGQGGK